MCCEEFDRPYRVFDMYPGHPLLTRAQGAAREEAKWQNHARQHAAIFTQGDSHCVTTRAGLHHSRLALSVAPTLRHVGEKVGARSMLFVHLLVGRYSRSSPPRTPAGARPASGDAAWMAATTPLVDCIRLSRSFRFCAYVQRLLTMLSPARLTTACAPSANSAHPSLLLPSQ